MRRMKLSSNNVNMNFHISNDPAEVKYMDNIIVFGGDLDYNKLKNKPTLNGREIVGNLNEADPQVPGWAKEEQVPAQPVPTEEVEKWLNGESEEQPEEGT